MTLKSAEHDDNDNGNTNTISIVHARSYKISRPKTI